MKNNKIKWNKVYFIDCLDPNNGLPSLLDKSIDLGYTDPPWGVNMHSKTERKYNNKVLKWDKSKKYFKDEFDPEFNLAWFTELERVCKGIILVIPEKHKYWWIRNTEPKGDLIIHWNNGFSASSIARHCQKSTYLFYGKFNNRLHKDVIDATLIWGFLKTEKFIHPSPKGIEIAIKILKQIKPISLIDPFTGSGSYLKAADILGIKWLGFELDKAYKPDINKRFSKQLITKWAK